VGVTYFNTTVHVLSFHKLAAEKIIFGKHFCSSGIRQESRSCSATHGYVCRDFFSVSWRIPKSNSAYAVAVSLQLAACLLFVDIFPVLSPLYDYKVLLNNLKVSYRYFL
jgi:hypothetical protein